MSDEEVEAAARAMFERWHTGEFNDDDGADYEYYTESARVALEALAARRDVPGGREAREVCEALDRVIAWTAQDNANAMEFSLRVMIGDKSPAMKLDAWRRAALAAHPSERAER